MQKRRMQLLFLSLISSLFFFCKTNNVHHKGQENKEIITFESKEKTTVIYNENKSKILILNYTTNKSPVITFKYQVVDATTKEELKKGVFIGEKIEWLDNTTLKCTPHIGMIQKQDDVILKDSTTKNTQYIIIKID
ncbi:MAG: hypothetical protein ACPGTO_08420 [Polaribacter sp.]